MHRMTTRLVWAVPMLLVVACGTASPTVHLDSGDNGRTIGVDVDDHLEIGLDGNPTTGYAWEVESLGGLDLVGGPSHEAISTAVGAPGITTYEFEASTPGTGELRLVYHRPWEDEPPLERFVVTVVVGG